MNLSAFQLFGVAVGAFFCYNSYIQYRKGVFGRSEFLTWLFVWGGLVLTSLVSAFFFPLTATVIFTYNLLDIITVLSITALAAISFSLYKKVKIQEQKMKEIIKKMAFEEES